MIDLSSSSSSMIDVFRANDWFLFWIFLCVFLWVNQRWVVWPLESQLFGCWFLTFASVALWKPNASDCWDLFAACITLPRASHSFRVKTYNTWFVWRVPSLLSLSVAINPPHFLPFPNMRLPLFVPCQWRRRPVCVFWCKARVCVSRRCREEEEEEGGCAGHWLGRHQLPEKFGCFPIWCWSSLSP